MTKIHSTAVIEDGASIGENGVIGPYCCIGSDVELSDGVILESHGVVVGKTSIGLGTHIFPFA